MFSIGAFAVIFDDRQRVLLCHRRDMDAWNLPGGGVESGELPTQPTAEGISPQSRRAPRFF